MRTNTLILAIAVIVDRAIAQDYDYQDYAEGYEEDNLYQDYAMKRDDVGRAGG